MSDSVFLIGEDGLRPMTQSPYESEDVFQQLIERYPEVLAGGQIDPASPRRWLLLRREAGIPDMEGGGDRWSLDHLLVDQDGIPTLVEVKRASDTRIRREVVGQMLDYAANGSLHWSADRLRSWLADAQGGTDAADEAVAELCGGDVDEWWSALDEHLRAGRVRMVFVADELPSELRRIIEFLNAQLRPAEVLGVELRRYASGTNQVLVPRVVGRTEAATANKPRTRAKYDDLVAQASDSWIRSQRRLAEWASDRGLEPDQRPQSWVVLTPRATKLLAAYPGYATVDVYLDRVRLAGLDDEADRLSARLNELVGRQLTAKVPAVPAADLLGVIESVITEVLDPLATLYAGLDEELGR